MVYAGEIEQFLDILSIRHKRNLIIFEDSWPSIASLTGSQFRVRVLNMFKENISYINLNLLSKTPSLGGNVFIDQENDFLVFVLVLFQQVAEEMSILVIVLLLHQSGQSDNDFSPEVRVEKLITNPHTIQVSILCILKLRETLGKNCL